MRVLSPLEYHNNNHMIVMLQPLVKIFFIRAPSYVLSRDPVDIRVRHLWKYYHKKGEQLMAHSGREPAGVSLSILSDLLL